MCCISTEARVCEYDIKLSNDIGNTALKPALSSEIKVGSCYGGRVLELTAKKNFTSGSPVYGWIKVASIVPADLFWSIAVCETGVDGVEYYWTGGFSTFVGDYPEVIEFQCDVISGDLYCSKNKRDYDLSKL
jgi:hypothetical protein